MRIFFYKSQFLISKTKEFDFHSSYYYVVNESCIHIIDHSSSEYVEISFFFDGNPYDLHHFLIALSLTPNFSPIETKGIVLISCLSSSLEGLSNLC